MDAPVCDESPGASSGATSAIERLPFNAKAFVSSVSFRKAVTDSGRLVLTEQ